MQIVGTGEQNVMLTGDPTKSFFKSTYRQYTNFGLQKFRVDFSGSRTLRMSEESTFTFKIPRYADLLMDSYLSVDLPHIWSPVMPPNPADNRATWAPYDFRWIPNLGAKMIAKIAITCGNQTLQEFSGDYLLAAAQRDFGASKLALFHEMIGHVPEMVDPGNAAGRVNSYPNAMFRDPHTPSEPSIRGRTLYVPLNTWFGLNSTMAFPLVSLQYNELNIVVTLRPVSELFVIRDVDDELNGFPLVAPNFNRWTDQLHRFLQTPPESGTGAADYLDTRTQWNADVHLNCTYCFLSDPERDLFAKNEQRYLIRQVRESQFMNVTGPNRVELNSLGMVASWMFYFQRSDANLRNAWSNYSNWPYDHLPVNVEAAPSLGTHLVYRTEVGGEAVPAYIGPGANPDGTATGLVVAPAYASVNTREILVSMGILLGGAYRENVQPAGVFNLIEKYARTPGRAPLGLYCYNFGVHGGARDTQPSGAINMNLYPHVELEINTIAPILDPQAQSLNICDPDSGEVVGVNKPTWRIYDYNFNLTVFEERLNTVTFASGNAGLEFAT